MRNSKVIKIRYISSEKEKKKKGKMSEYSPSTKLFSHSLTNQEVLYTQSRPIKCHSSHEFNHHQSRLIVFLWL